MRLPSPPYPPPSSPPSPTLCHLHSASLHCFCHLSSLQATSSKMSSTPDSIGSTASTSIDETTFTPLWEYVVMTKTSKAGGNKSFICNFCKITFNGSYFRVKAHLLKIAGHGIRACTKLTKEEVARLSKLQVDADLRVKAKVPKQVPLPSAQTSPATSVSIGVRE